jgi:prephenate dehydrogenase
MDIAIVGMGLIGTSLGMAIRSADEQVSPLGAIRVIGYDADRSATSIARERLAIDRGAKSLAEAVKDAKLVIVATPVLAVRELFVQLAPLLSDGTTLTDVASTKAQVCAWAREILPAHVDFVGGHPMAGKEQAGAQAADPALFQQAIYCLTPSPTVRQHALELVEALVRTIEARPYFIDADEHDAYVAGISHLPFLLSTCLVEMTSRSPAWQEMAALAATGFRDMSRLASGDAVMHRDICMTNRTALIRWINDTLAFLVEVRTMLEADDAAQVGTLFEHAREVREAWLQQQDHLRETKGEP